MDDEVPKLKVRADDDWVATCGVCEANFAVLKKDCLVKPPLTFCPDCRKKGMKAPGVLNWRKRNEKAS